MATWSIWHTLHVAARAESSKDEKYSDLLHTHEFTPVAVEPFGVFVPRSLLFMNELGKKLRDKAS